MRIPYDGGRPGEWGLWRATCDRLPGMSSLRFFNFRSRGWHAWRETVAHNVCSAGRKGVRVIILKNIALYRCFYKKTVLVEVWWLVTLSRTIKKEDQVVKDWNERRYEVGMIVFREI